VLHSIVGRILLAAFVFAATIGGCTGPSSPTQNQQSECARVGSLDCYSPSIPDGHTCCVVGTNPSASVGYLCAFGAGQLPAGCFASNEQARQVCPNAPSVVQCRWNWGSGSPPSSSNCRVSCWACTTRPSSRYDAIAYSPSTRRCGSSWDYQNRAGAESRAVSECGVADCTALLWFQNACGALAVGENGRYGYAWAGTRTEAEQSALNYCN